MTKGFNHDHTVLFFYDYNNYLIATYYIEKEKLKVNETLRKDQVHYIYNNIKHR